MSNKKQSAALAAAKEATLTMAGVETVYTQVHTVARSGMSRTMSAFIVRGGKIESINHLIVTMDCAGAKWAKNKGFKVNGCGMDMGFAVVADLSRALHGDYKKINHKWL